MKKTLHIVGVILLLLALSSCSLLAPLSPPGTGPATKAPLPKLSEVREATEAARPIGSAVTVLATYTEPAVTLTATFGFTEEGDTVSYTYRTERLLPIEEAVAAGRLTEELSGHLVAEGDTLTDFSPEVTEGLLSGLGSLTFRHPSLQEGFFTSYAISEAEGGYRLLARVENSAVPMLFDGKAEGLCDLVLTLTLDSTLRPTETEITCRAADGAAIVYHATYRYR